VVRQINEDQLINLFFKHSQTSFVLLDRDYNFIRVNESYAKSCGKDVDYFPGKNHFEIYPSNAKDIFDLVKQTKKPFAIDARPFVFPDDDGQKITYWDWNLEPVLDSAGEVDFFVWAIKDVTERERAQNDNDRFLNLSLNMVCKATFDGYFVELSPAWQKVLGHTEEVLKSKPFINFVHPDDIENTLKEASRLATHTGETVKFENRYLCADGCYRWLSWNSIGVKEEGLIYAIAHDITDLKHTQEALYEHRSNLEKLVIDRSQDLARSEQRLAYLLSNSPAVIYTCEAKGNYPATFISENVQQMFGYDPELFTENANFWAEHIHPDEVPRVFKDLQNLFTNNRHSHEYRFQAKNGKYFWVHDELRLQRDENGEPREIIGYWADITQRKEIETALENARLEAEQANRSKSEFISSMSHELRTPLNAIIGFSDLLSLEDLNEELLAWVDDIKSGGKHLLSLISDILDLSAIESGNISISIESVDTRQILEECLVLVSPSAEKSNISIKLANHSTVLPQVLADQTRFKQIILNLLSNAIKYNTNNGEVIIEICEGSKQTHQIRVSNTGQTIKPELQEKLFKPFERLGAELSNIEGTGIGLVVCKRLMELMNGKIGYEINDDNYSTFWIELPAADSKMISNHDSDSDSAKDYFKTINTDVSKRILYIEDNRSNIKLVNTILKKANFETHIANDGNLGLEIAMTIDGLDLILLDIHLPGLSGYEIVQRLKANEKTASIPVIALTANATKDDIRKGVDYGFDGYLTKPIEVKKLLKTIKEHLLR